MSDRPEDLRVGEVLGLMEKSEQLVQVTVTLKGKGIQFDLENTNMSQIVRMVRQGAGITRDGPVVLNILGFVAGSRHYTEKDDDE